MYMIAGRKLGFAGVGRGVVCHLIQFLSHVRVFH